MNTPDKELENYGEPWHLCGQDRATGPCVCLQIWSTAFDIPICTGIDEKDPSVKAEGVPALTQEAAKRTMRRVVACVNACKGIPTDRLENNDEEVRVLLQAFHHKIIKDFLASHTQEELTKMVEESRKAVHGDSPSTPLILAEQKGRNEMRELAAKVVEDMIPVPLCGSKKQRDALVGFAKTLFFIRDRIKDLP